MHTLTKRMLGLSLATAALAACSNTDNGPSLNLQEKTALSTALTSSGALTGAGAAGSFGAVAIYMLPNIGTLSAGSATSAAVRGAINASLSGVRAASYEGAVGFQVIYTSAGSSSTFTGVMGWTGLNVAASTVDETVAAGALTSTATPVANGSATTIGGASGFGTYYLHSPLASYAGTSGSFNLTTASFGGTSVNCTSLASGVASCGYVTGTMSGNFNFAASRVSGTGALSYTQTPIHFTNLPAVKITIVD